MYENREREMLDNKSICDDKIFAQLTDLFGDTVPTETILKTGQETKWKLEHCIEKLVKFDPSTVQRSMSVEMETNNNNNNISDDDDADVLIESEEIQQASATPTSKKSNAAAKNDEQEKRSPWPYYKQHNAGFGASNTSLSNHRPGPKQPRLISNTVDKHPDLPDIIKHIEQNHRILICMRGAPGSGKSHLARSIIDRTMHGDYENHIFSTDDFFFDKRTKQYIFDRNRLSQAHESNQFRVGQRAMNGWSPIIIDNTNMKWWEMFPYFKIAVQYGYIIKILEPNTPWRISVGKLAMKNKHGVDQDQIARMLSNYEPGTVEDILRAMQIYNYQMTPQLRSFPEIQQPQPSFSDYGSNQATFDNSISRFTPKEQRSTKKFEWNRENLDYRLASTSENKFDSFTEAWPAFEEEQTSFWNKESESKQKLENNLPKPQRAKQTGNANIENMFSLLHDKSNSQASDAGKEAESVGASLKRHKKDCTNENKSFQEIRQIYPQIPVALLWDLFEKCKGDGNWTMDILLNESETKDIQTLNSQEDIDRDNFTCECDKPASTLSADFSQAVEAIPAEWLKDSRAQSQQPTRNQRRQKQSIPNENDVLKHIEQQFVISDNHYSDHSRKIRDSRRGLHISTATSIATTSNQSTAKASGSITPDDNTNEDDEMIEIDLGIELVCQLDAKFGSNTFQSESLKDIKTKVFMPKSLGQQLYATWIESLYHQIEEQKQQSIKDDEEFAKELQIKTPKTQNLFEVAPANSSVQNIADMEYTWKAYNCNANEWKQTTREDLAMKLTKAKLYEIFPNVDREQLLEVFQSYGFSKTVEFFKENLKSEIDEQIQAKGQELAIQASVEAQAIRPPQPSNSKPNKHKIQGMAMLDKLDREDAKRAALRDFEENRNMAMHHSHLKAECYNKAREAFQRKQTGVAYYYTNVANLHNQKIDMYNCKAANAIVEVHSYTQQDPNMLDLHYLHADEAIQCLDIYIDRHINELKDAKRGFKYVFIITGRGLHSAGGFSTIKHRVKCRLKERTLSWAEVNPGLLKVKLQYISLFTDNVNNN